MKKVLSAILVLALALSSMALTVSAAELENLTKDATLTASSGDAAKAGDQDTATAWVADGADADITLEIGMPLPMGYLEIEFGENVATDFIVSASSDAASWTEIVNVTGNGKGNYVYEWTASTQRYLKVDINAVEDDKAATIAEIIVRENKTKEDRAANAAYPSSGVEIPEGSYLINGEVIGLMEGWGGNPTTGAKAAFDGNIDTYFDPLGTANGWAGMDAGEEFTLTKIVIHPRSANLARYYGAEIDGSNDPDFADYTPIYVSIDEAAEFDYIEISADDFDDIGSFRYYRYYNTLSHGDVAEVELYGEPTDGTYDAAVVETEAPVETEPETEAPVETEPETEAPVETEPEVVETEAPETEAEVVEEADAPQTFDFGVVAAVAAVVSLAGYAVSKKH